MEWFRRYFVPHEGNGNRPHVLRWEVVSVVCAVAIVGELALLSGMSFVAPQSRLFGTILASALVDGTNQNRTSGNLPLLRVSPLLQAAAQQKANDMAANSYFAHTSPAGLTPWYWFEKVGYKFAYAGENLAINFSDSQDVTNAWMQSPGHRANILNGNFTEIGIATATGTYQGMPTIFVVEMFGSPAAVQAPPVVAAKTPPQKKPAPSAPKPKLAPIAKTTSTTSTPPQQSFIAVQGVEAAPAPAESAPVEPQNNIVQGLASSPKQTANAFYLTLILLFGAVLAFNIYMRLHMRHLRLIANGAAVMALAALFLFVNQYLGIGSVGVL